MFNRFRAVTHMTRIAMRYFREVRTQFRFGGAYRSGMMLWTDDRRTWLIRLSRRNVSDTSLAFESDTANQVVRQVLVCRQRHNKT